MSRIILYLEVRELCYIYILGLWFLKSFFFFFCIRSYQIQIIFKQIYLINRWYPNRYYYSRSQLSWEGMLQNWSLTIRCSLMSYSGYSFFFKMRKGVLLSLQEMQSVFTYQTGRIEKYSQYAVKYS